MGRLNQRHKTRLNCHNALTISASKKAINAGDQINGGSGTNTFKAYGALGTLPASMTGIENLVLVNPGTLAITDTTVGFAGITTAVWAGITAVGASTFTLMRLPWLDKAVVGCKGKIWLY